MSTEPLREARLRPEFASRYPGVEAGVWYTAATLAEHNRNVERWQKAFWRGRPQEATVPDSGRP